MSLCISIFQKDIYSLTVEDLKLFFSEEQEETSVLEFKSGGVELEDVYKEISAFLNTEGGLLILGAPKEKKKQVLGIEKKICFGDLEKTKFSNQDSLVRGIASNISPSPSDIKVKQLEYDDGYVFVLEVKQSLTPPHQVSSEGKYYIRLERDSKPAPHGLVEALFFKRQKPNLIGELDVKKVSENELHFELVFKNKSLVTAENITYTVNFTGISEISRAVNVNRAVPIIGNIYDYQENFKDLILVKGIETKVEYFIKPIISKRLILIKLGYWCKDMPAIFKVGLYDVVNGKFEKTFVSDSIENEFTLQELYEFYDKN